MITSWSTEWKCSVTRSRLDAFPITCGISQSFSWLASYWSPFVSLWWKWICLSPRVLDISLKSVVAVLCIEIFLDTLLQWQNGIGWDEGKNGDSLEFSVNSDRFSILAPTSPLKKCVFENNPCNFLNIMLRYVHQKEKWFVAALLRSFPAQAI